MKCFARFVFVVFLIQATPVWALLEPPVVYRPVALRGQQVPGAAAGTTFNSFFSTSINSIGHVAFNARLAQQADVVTTANDSGIWVGGTRPLATLAREGSPAPSLLTPGNYTDFDGIQTKIGDSGDVAWRGRYNDGQFNQQAIWVGSPSNVEVVAQDGMQAPGTPVGTLYSITSDPTINSQGAVAIASALRVGPGGVTQANNFGVWITNGGTTSLVVRKGSQAPGAPAGANFDSFYSNLRFNSAGEVAFGSDLTLIEVATQRQFGIWSTAGGALNLVARDFDPAPGAPAGAEFNFLSSTPTAFNSSGAVAFSTLLRISAAAGVDSNNDSGIWSSGKGSLALLAREGDQAPSMPMGAKFASFVDPLLSDQGATAFIASLATDAALGITTNNDTGLWSDTGGALSLVAREGTQAPGMPAGALFNSFLLRTPLAFATNGAGHVAFTTFARDGGVTTVNDQGLWAHDASGMLRLLLREGDTFAVAPGDNRVISAIQMSTDSGGGDGLRRGFTDDYRIPVILRFSDGSAGVFVVGFAVPEPATAVLGIAGALAVFLRAKPRR